MDLLPYLLPLGASLQVNQLLIESDGEAVTVELEAIAPASPCPSCHLRQSASIVTTSVPSPTCPGPILSSASTCWSASSSVTTPPAGARSSLSVSPTWLRPPRDGPCA